MKTKIVIISFLFFFSLASCTPAVKVVSSETVISTPILTPILSTITFIPTPTKSPTSIQMLTPIPTLTPTILKDSPHVIDLNTLIPMVGIATMDVVCPSIKPYTIGTFSAGMKIQGAAMLFPDNGEAWIVFGSQLEKNGVVFPKHFWWSIGISVYSYTDVVIPKEITIHVLRDTMTMRVENYKWIPEGKVLRFRSDDEMEWYAACAIQKAGQ